MFLHKFICEKTFSPATVDGDTLIISLNRAEIWAMVSSHLIIMALYTVSGTLGRDALTFRNCHSSGMLLHSFHSKYITEVPTKLFNYSISIHT